MSISLSAGLLIMLSLEDPTNQALNCMGDPASGKTKGSVHKLFWRPLKDTGKSGKAFLFKV